MNRLQPQGDGNAVQKNQCPYCGHRTDHYTVLSGGEAKPPQPGDLSICIRCGNPSLFNEEIALRRMTEAEIAALPQDVMMMIVRVKGEIAIRNPEHRANYASQCNKMLAIAQQWRGANPEKTALVQFNFPPDVALICEIGQAVHRKLVTCNEAGQELLRALGMGGGESEPTVLMVRAVLEHE